MTGRIRTIKPEWLEDELLAAASDEARVLSVALILMSDDYGRGRASRATLANGAWRFEMDRDDGERARETLAKASRALRELVAIHFVRVYEVAGQQYFEIRNWTKHQKVDKPSKPRIPEPPADIPQENRGLSEPSRDPREEASRPSRDPRETLATDLRPPTTTTTTTTSADLARAHAHAHAREPLPPSLFEVRCEQVRAALWTAWRDHRRCTPPPALGLGLGFSQEVTAIARWLSTSDGVELEAMARRWACARWRDGRWAPLSALARDPTEWATEPRSASAIASTPEREQQLVDEFIAAGTKHAESTT